MAHKIGIVGAGDVVRRGYLPALIQRSDCKLVAIASRDGKSAQKLASIYGIEKVFLGYENVLDCSDIDVVLVCTPPYLHREIAEAAMRCGKNLLVEKPLCTNYRDSRLLLESASAYPKTFYPAFNNFFREENQWLRSTALRGGLGTAELIDFEWFRTKRYEDKSWLYDGRFSGGGALMDLGLHLLHLALSLVPNRKKFRAFCHNSKKDRQARVEDTSIAVIEVDKVIPIVIKVGWSMHLQKPSEVVLRLYGSDGLLANRAYEGEKTDGYGNMIEDFLEYVTAGSKPDLGLVQDTMMLVDALYGSANSQGAICGEFIGGTRS